jgi:predicted SnoaL-like aldol condensation-catalyzing enzyme
VSRRVYDSAISTGRAEDVDAVAETYIRTTGWTPDGRSVFANAGAVGRGAMPNGRAVQTHVAAENDRVASISVCNGAVTESGRPVDFTSADFFRIQDGLAAEHWDTVDYVRRYQSFGLLPDDIDDVLRRESISISRCSPSYTMPAGSRRRTLRSRTSTADRLRDRRRPVVAQIESSR